ncbi:MAG: hypothetical protein P1U57_10730, partial [Oleibacter sp.]|nr:hypothetical protein [Thalassolituus sp.]
DLRFITAWIGLSACCVTSARNDQTVPNFLPLVQRLTEFDSNKRYYQLLWQQYSGPVKELIKNPYVFAPYWEAQRAADSKDNQWRPAFEQSSVAALNCLSRQRVPELVAIVFDRLYVLQNQLIQGGATYQGRVNRSQVSHGAAMAEALLAVTIDIMLEHADEHWGDLIYPVSDSY